MWRTAWDIDGNSVASVIHRRGSLSPQDIAIDYSISPASFEYISYVDLLQGRVSPDLLAGRDVFIGNYSMELGDTVAVPVYGTLPGVAVQALATETVTQGVPRGLPAWLSLALLAAWAVIAGLAFRLRWGRNLALLGMLLVAIGAVSILAFAAARLQIEVAAPAAVVVLCFTAVTLRSLDRQTSRALTYALGLRRRDALLRSVVQSSTDCIICIDLRGLVRTANPAAGRLFGVPPQVMAPPRCRAGAARPRPVLPAEKGSRWRSVSAGSACTVNPCSRPSCATSASGARSSCDCSTRQPMMG
jgi:PAS domain-containing protein